jgi:hypothetical protein
VYRADSRNGGVTWGDAARTALVNPVGLYKLIPVYP